MAEEQAELLAEDVYYGDPESSSLKLSSDIHTGKPSTDVIVVGNACAPAGTSLQVMDVRLAFANQQKMLRVFGDRVWQQGHISEPLSFTQMPLVYERAFGGGFESRCHQLNPVGTGFAAGRSADDMDGVALPNIENPQQLINGVKDEPQPIGVGALAPHWLPRRTFAGTYDQDWQQKRAPFLPHDFDSRFCQCAPIDQVSSEYLVGGEPFLIEGMHPGGQVRFNLPGVSLNSKIEIQSQWHEPEFKLETVVIQPNDLQIYMVWRLALPCGKLVSRIGDIVIQMRR